MDEGPASRRDELRRRAAAVATGVAQAPFAILVAVFIILGPSALAIAATNWAFGTGSLVLETLVVVVLVAVTAGALWWSLASGGIQSLLRFGRLDPTLRASMLAVFAGVSFTSLTILLHEHGLVGMTPEPAHDELLDETLGFYLWQSANTLPFVDAPGNLDWPKPFEFDDALGGLLVILFTGFVILPLIRLAQLILAGGDVPFDAKVVRALDRHVGSQRISVLRSHEGYGRAIVDEDVLVDVMRAVWNQDAAILRLERLSGRPAQRRPHGYLLVVDAIAQPARDRIEPALEQAPFAATLAVWREDQRVEDLTAAFDGLQQRVKAER